MKEYIENACLIGSIVMAFISANAVQGGDYPKAIFYFILGLALSYRPRQINLTVNVMNSSSSQKTGENA